MVEWKIGDKVQLTPNGPVMTVIGQVANNEVRCSWPNKEEKLDVGIFLSDSLVQACPED